METSATQRCCPRTQTQASVSPFSWPGVWHALERKIPRPLPLHLHLPRLGGLGGWSTTTDRSDVFLSDITEDRRSTAITDQIDVILSNHVTTLRTARQVRRGFTSAEPRSSARSSARRLPEVAEAPSSRPTCDD